MSYSAFALSTIPGMCVPYRQHIVIHLLELLLSGLQGIGRRVELVGFEALIR